VNGRILIIDTNGALAGLWAKRFESDFFEVDILVDGETKYSDIAKKPLPEVIVSGLEPERNAPCTPQEICSAIYGKKAGKALPALIQLHSVLLPPSKKAKIEKAAFSVMMKPVSPARLLEEARRAFLHHVRVRCEKEGEATMTVALQGGALLGLLQFVEMGKRSGITTVASSDNEAYIEFNKGRPIDAKAGRLAGEDAVMEILSWKDGQASFFERTIKNDNPASIPAVKTLVEKHAKQTIAMGKAEDAFDDPDALIAKNGSPKAPEDDSDAVRILEALDGERSLSELTDALPNMPRRRLLSALGRLLDRHDVRRTRRVDMEDASGLSSKLVQEALAVLCGDDTSMLVRHPASIGVYCSEPRTARRFIGALCGRKMASHAVFAAGKHHILLGEVQKRAGSPDFFDVDASIVILDTKAKNAEDAAAKSLDAARSAEAKFILATPQESPAGKAPVPSVFGLDERDMEIAPFQWDEKSVLSVVETLFASLV